MCLDEKAERSALSYYYLDFFLKKGDNTPAAKSDEKAIKMQMQRERLMDGDMGK